MKTNRTAKPVTVIKSGVKTEHKTRNDASTFLFGKIDKEALDNLMRNPTEDLSAYYTYSDDLLEFNKNSA